MPDKPEDGSASGGHIHVEQTAVDVRGKMTGVEIHQFYGEIIVRPERIEELPPADGEPPYKGLTYYTEADADIFFGRERLTGRLVDRLQEAHFLAVVGASGSGKSSLLRAGVVPALREQNWAIHILTPTANPLTSLATNLTRGDSSLAAAGELRRALANDGHALSLATDKLAAQANQNRLLLLVDQFEETFTLCKDEGERRGFLNCLQAAAAAQSAAAVLIGVRADFYDRCLQYKGLRRVLAEQQEPLGPMTPEELMRVIAEPAKRGGWQLVEGLVEQMLEDVGREPGRLPLLSHALRETWERRRGTVMTLAGYRDAGGVEGAIAQTAEDTLQNLPEQWVEIAKRIFLSLTELGEGSEDTRRIAEAEQLARLGDEGQVAIVIERLVRARLVTVDGDQVEVAHEALIRRWPRLRAWLEDNRERLRFERQLARDAEAWERLERDPGALYRGARLARALAWWQRDDGETRGDSTLDPQTEAFLEASRDLADTEAREEEARRRRELEQERALAEEQRKRAEEAEARRATEQRRAEEQERAARRLRRLVVGFAVVALLAFIAGGVALFANRQAQRQARIATARALAAQSAEASTRDFKDSLLLAVAAMKTTVDEGEPPVPEALVSLYRTLATDRDFSVALGHPDWFWSVAFSPDGERLITTGRGATPFSGRAWLWDTSGNLLRVFNGHDGAVRSAAFSRDGARVATASRDGTVRLWDVADNGSGDLPPVVLEAHAVEVDSVAFSPNGDRVVTFGCDEADSDSRIFYDCIASSARLWDATGDGSGNLLAVFEGHTGSILSTTFSRDGERVLIVSSDGTARLWDPTGNSHVVLEDVNTAAFSPDGERMITTRCNNREDGDGDCIGSTARLWNAASGVPGDVIAVLEGHTGSIVSAAFSRDGVRVLTIGNGAARLWDDSGKLVALFEGIKSADLSPDGERVVTVSDSDAVQVWAVSGDSSGDGSGVLLAIHEGHTDSVQSAAFSPDGDRIVTVGDDGTARLWDGAGNSSGKLSHVLDGHTDRLTLAAFSPDGEWVVTAGDDGTVRLWDASGRLLHILESGGSIEAAAFSPDGERLVTNGSSGKVLLWDVSGVGAGELQTIFEGHTSGVLSMAFSPDGGRIVTASIDETARLWDASGEGSGDLLAVLKGHSGAVNSAAFSPDGERVVTGGDSTARLWDVAGNGSGDLLANSLAGDLSPIVLEGHIDEVLSVAFSSDGQRVFTRGSNAVRLWRASGELLHVLEDHPGFIYSTAFSPDGERIVTASLSGAVRLWAAAGRGSSDLLAILEGHTGAVYSAAFSPDGERLITAGEDDMARLWDTSGNLLAVLEGHTDDLFSAAFSPDGKRVITASADGTARVWVVDAEILLAEARRQLLPMLTLEECQQTFPEDCPPDAGEVPLP